MNVLHLLNIIKLIGLHRLYKFKYMEIVNNIVSELKTDVNQLNNEEFINVCLLFHKQFQLIDGIIVNDLMNLNTNKVIMSELYKLSKLNGNNIFFSIYLIIQ